MANYNTLLTTINTNIKANGNQEITGPVLNSVLTLMTNELGAGYQFAGLANPGTVAPSTDAKIFLFASEAGEYTHFHDSYGDPIELAEGELAILANGTYWTKYVIATLPVSSLTIDTDVPDLGYNEADPQTISDQMGQSVEDVLSAGAVCYAGDATGKYYKVVGYYENGGYITFIGVDKVYQYNVNADGYITGEKVTSLAPDNALSDTSENAVQNKVVKAAFDAKQDKDTNAIEGNVAVMDASGNSEGSNVPLNKVAKIDGQYDTLISGYAGNLIDKSDAGSEQQIMFRKTGGTTEVSASTRAMFKRLLGRSLVWNQQCANGDFADNSNIKSMSSGTYIVSNGICEVTPDVNSNSGISRKMSEMAKPNNHKFYIRFEHQGAAIRVSTFNIGSFDVPAHDSMTKCSNIVTVGSESWAFDLVYFRNNTGGVFRLKNTISIDLTVKYGAGYEPANVAEFESVYNKPYYPHNTGTFIHNVAQTYEATGQNQWDEEWQKGYWNGGAGDTISFVSTNNQICSKNPIPVVYGQTYYAKCPMPGITPGTAGYFNVRFTDANGVIVGLMGGLNTTFVAPAGAVYMYFVVSSVYGSVYNHDICINLSNADINGTYAPYVKATATLGLSAFRVKDGQGNITTVNGLKGTGATYNEIDVENKTYIKRVEMRAYQSGDDSDASVLTDGTNTLAPLAEPVVYDLVDDMPTDCQTWGVGTENILPEGVDENGVPKTAPLRAVIYYPKDYTGIINNLPKNYISKESLTNMLNALKSAGVIRSFTMTWNAETQTYNFTIS